MCVHCDKFCEDKEIVHTFFDRLVERDRHMLLSGGTLKREEIFSIKDDFARDLVECGHKRTIEKLTEMRNSTLGPSFRAPRIYDIGVQITRLWTLTRLPGDTVFVPEDRDYHIQLSVMATPQSMLGVALDFFELDTGAELLRNRPEQESPHAGNYRTSGQG